MITISETKIEMQQDPKNWLIPFMDFVDDFRRRKDKAAVRKAFPFDNERFDAILASTIEYLCGELNLDPPDWTWDVPPCKEPWFLSGLENLKAMAIAESPVYFRRRKIFVLENFLQRV